MKKYDKHKYQQLQLIIHLMNPYTKKSRKLILPFHKERITLTISNTCSCMHINPTDPKIAQTIAQIPKITPKKSKKKASIMPRIYTPSN